MTYLLLWLLLVAGLVLAFSLPGRLLQQKFIKRRIFYSNLQIALGLILLIYVIKKLSNAHQGLSWFLPIPIAALSILIFQELFAGVLFRLLHRPEPGQQLRIGNTEGRLVQLTHNQLHLQQGNMLIKLPFMRILWQEVQQLQSSANHKKHPSLELHWPLPEERSPELYRHKLHQLLLLWPYMLPSSEPGIRYVDGPQPHFELLVSLTSSVKPEQLEAYLEKYLD